jgi:hypothetical protein
LRHELWGAQNDRLLVDGVNRTLKVPSWDSMTDRVTL